MGSGPKGVDGLCFHTDRGIFVLHLLLAIGIWAFGLRLRPWGWDLGLRAGIWALRLRYGSQVLYLRLEVRFWAVRPELGLKAGTWVSRLRFGPLKLAIGPQG